MLFCLLLVLFFIPNVRTQQADVLHEKAIELATRGSYTAALSVFRTALRLQPNSVLYLNDVGVTEMRLGLYEKAERHFLAALAIDPQYEASRDNLRDLQGYLKQLPKAERLRSTNSIGKVNRHDDICLKRKQSHKLQSPIHIDGDRVALSPLPLHIPFVITSMKLVWNTSEWKSQLVELFGAEIVDYYPQNMNDVHDSVPYLTPMATALREFDSDVQNDSDDDQLVEDYDRTASGAYVQWNMGEVQWKSMMSVIQKRPQESQGPSEDVKDCNSECKLPFTIPTALLDSDWFSHCLVTNETDLLQRPFLSPISQSHFNLKTHWQMLLIGKEGAGMFVHQDVLRVGAWQLQLQGRKRWHICAPDQSAYLYNAGDVNLFHPDSARFPLVNKASCFDFIVHPGELVYYPQDYWHQTTNLDTPTISLSSSVLTKDNAPLLTKELEKECDGAGRIFAVDVEGTNSDQQTDSQSAAAASGDIVDAADPFVDTLDETIRDADAHKSEHQKNRVMCRQLRNKCFGKWKE